jgi:hypothetical protein
MMSRLPLLALSFAFVGFAACLFAPVAAANVLANGGFETPPQALGTYVTIVPGGEPAGFAWKVASGDVDLAYLPVVPFVDYSAYEGLQALDLNGTVPGAIFQDFPTMTGQAYSLSLAYADNPVDLAVLKTASIKITDVTTTASLLATSISHSTSTNSPPNADWITVSFGFTAAGPTSRLTIASTSADASPSGGIILDAVDVHAVPEPSSVVLLAAALASLLGIKASGNARRG